MIKLNQQEVEALLQLIHIAVQARGLEVAEAGAYLARKLKEGSNVETSDGSTAPSEA